MPARKKRSSGTPPAPAGITALSVRGFKAIREEQRIEIRPLTILAGANSSGKSSMLQPLLLLKQTLEAPYDPGPLLLDGPNVQFTSASQIFSKSGNGGAAAATVELQDDIGFRFEFKPVPRSHGVELVSMSWREGTTSGELRSGMSPEQLASALGEASAQLLSRRSELGTPDAEWRVGRSRFFLESVFGTQEKAVLRLNMPAYRPLLENAVSALIHVPGVRGNPERSYRSAASGPAFPGRFNDYVGSVVLNWERTERSLLKALARSLDELELTSAVRAQPIEATRVEVEVARTRAGDGKSEFVNIADVGLGVSQVLPVVVALLAARSGQFVYIEEPEIHLHPRAQVRMARLLADAALRGVRVVAETHSSLLLRGVQTLVAQGELDPGLVRLHWFQRNAKSGFARVHSSDLDAQGRFETAWPLDFDQVEVDSDAAYLSAAEGHG